MSREVKVYLLDILESLEKIEEYIKGISKSEFLANTEKQDAVIKRLEIIGEAVKNLPVRLRKKYPQIPWRKIAGMRDVLVHAYFGISMERVWKTVRKELPPFKIEIKKILEEY